MIVRVALLLPPALGVLLGMWAISVLLSSPETSVKVSGLVLVTMAVILGFWGTFQYSKWPDRLCILLLGLVFLGIGTFTVGLGIVELYLFTSLLIFLAHTQRIRRIFLPLKEIGVRDSSITSDLRSAYLASLARGIISSLFVFFISVMILAGSLFTFLPISADVGAFVWALVILTSLLAISLILRTPLA